MPDHPDSTSVAHRFDLPDGTSYPFTMSVGDLWSHQHVALTVTTPERSFVFDDVQLQDALRSLMGLVLATKGGDADFSQLLPMAVEESLAPLRPMFEAYVRPPGSPGAG